jgi:PhnB protein
MVSTLNPYLGFRGNAREAMEFYGSVFGTDPTFSTFGEFGMEGVAADQIMHGQLTTPAGLTLMGADIPEGMPCTPGTAMTVCLSGDDVAELHGWWDKLIEGADVDTPLATQMWGDEYGSCTDRFGVPWMVNITLPKE